VNTCVNSVSLIYLLVGNNTLLSQYAARKRPSNTERGDGLVERLSAELTTPSLGCPLIHIVVDPP